jgi:hypothetical protein
VAVLLAFLRNVTIIEKSLAEAEDHPAHQLRHHQVNDIEDRYDKDCNSLEGR